MFTGIIETLGCLSDIKSENGNLHFVIESSISDELKVDQSVSHNGVCLTVIEVVNGRHMVTAVEETLIKSNLGGLNLGDQINLERCMQLNGRLDGHLVQGHVDQTAKCTQIRELAGSWEYTFSYDPNQGNVTVEKGSICVNGISLTVVNSVEGSFSVAIIPYTFEHTNMKNLIEGDSVNLEFDIIGKYVAKLMKI